MEIWIISNLPPPAHGVSIFNQLFVESLQKRGISHRFFRIGTQGNLSGIESFGIGKTLRDAAVIAQACFLALIRRLSGRGAPSLYFTPSQYGFGIWRDFFLVMMGRLAFGRIVGHLHGCRWLETYRSQPSVGRVMRWTLGLCDQVICLGESYARRMRDEADLRTVGINNGLPARPISSRTTESPGELLFLSALYRPKGLWIAAGAVRALALRGHRVKLTLAGTWVREDERAEFEREFSAEITGGVFRFAGFVTGAEKDALLARAALLLLPITNPFEGQPLTLIEAMQMGVVPLTTRFGGIGDLFAFEGGEMLSSTAHADPEGLARAIERLLANPSERSRLAERAQQHARDRLGFERCVDEILRAME